MEAKNQEKCENCGRLIGKLETPCVFSGQIVCFDCDALLRRQQHGKSDHVGSVPEMSPEALLLAAKLLEAKPETPHRDYSKSTFTLLLWVFVIIPIIILIIYGFVSYSTQQIQQQAQQQVDGQ